MNTRPRSPRAYPSILVVLLIILAAIAFSASYLGGQVRKAPAKSSLRVIDIPLDGSVEIRPVMAGANGTKHESFSKMMKRLKPYAAINGTFYSEAWVPIGDVLIDGKLEVAGKYPNALAVRKDGTVEIIRRKGAKFDWSGYKHAVAAGPRLVDNGQILLDPIADGFKQIARDIAASRSGIAITKDNKLLLVVCTEPVKLLDFAKMMLDLGAKDAMNLDGGPACGLYSDGKVVIDAGLQMTNVLIVNKTTPTK